MTPLTSVQRQLDSCPARLDWYNLIRYSGISFSPGSGLEPGAATCAYVQVDVSHNLDRRAAGLVAGRSRGQGLVHHLTAEKAFQCVWHPLCGDQPSGTVPGQRMGEGPR